MASRKVAAASLPSLFLIGAFLLVMASPGAVSEADAASGQFPSLDRTPEPWPKNNRAVRAGSPVVSSLVGALPSAPASAPKGSAATQPQAPAPQPHPCPMSAAEESDEKIYLIFLIILILCCLFDQS